MNIQPTVSTRQMPAGLVALALGGFGTGLTEFVIAGLLPQVSRSLAVSEAAAGRLISGYALTVAVGAIVVTAADPVAAVVLVFLTGLFGFASVPGMITRVTDHARGVPLAAGAHVSASNLGNALGAWLGGFAIILGLGCTAPLYVGAVLVLIGLAVMIVAARRADRSAPETTDLRPAQDRASAG
ncbi:hypothetical protein ACFWDQ_12745 [Streptomyces sp. NPDC060053]|uniref:hypothetical protein n=1 Tax=Streptomyces sp. NPDC060053 TaxID=3347047 RepID=UPI0036CFE0BB